MTTERDTRPYVQVENLVARYGNRTILDGVSCSAQRGEITVILGGSGSGKTTLLRHIVGLLTPAAGRVLIDGRDIHRASEEEQEAILRNVGMSFQAGALFNSMTLEENIALPIMEHAHADRDTANTLARMKLALVGLERAAQSLPAEISGGMKKRAAVARALALDPALLLFDELSAGLDPVTARELDELVLRLKAQLDVAILVVTHELSSIQMIADRAVMLQDGKVLAAGTLDEVRSLDHPQVRAFFDRQPRSTVVQHGLLDALLVDGGKHGENPA
ncbi:MAG TPA: ATP-binding cassette domain-containing protein [Candidatus Binatia bacterium]|nr:ATP-binding cassette domain-containing protein [Candidatus Binatia bacterium]